MNHDNIKILFLIKNNENIQYIFLISEDKYEYTIASYKETYLTYIIFNINKITQDMEFKKEDSLVTKELNDMIKNSKNVEEYKFVNKLDYNKLIVKLVRKLKIKNICQ